MRLGFKPTAGADPVQVPINIELQEVARCIRRTAHLFRHNLGKTQLSQIQAVNKRIDHTNWIVNTNQIVQNFREKRRLIPRLSANVRHQSPRIKISRHNYPNSVTFHTA